jgi:hypothetical protein
MDVTIVPCGSYQLTTMSWPRDAAAGWDGSNVGRWIVVAAERAVDPSTVVSVEDFFERKRADGSIGPGKALTSPAVDELTDGASRIGGAISFAIGVALVVMTASLPGCLNNFIAETSEDEILLDALGTDIARLPLLPRTGVEISNNSPVDARLVQELAQRGAVGLYGDILAAPTAVGKFRELWRTLELAFRAHGMQLVDLLMKFPPTAELGFDQRELESLLVLRGKVSHAASRGGTAALLGFEGDVLDAIGRLWSLVDRILLTKRDSSRSLDVEELRPLSAYIGSDGTVQFEANVTDRDGWIDDFGSTSVRFRQPTE